MSRLVFIYSGVIHLTTLSVHLDNIWTDNLSEIDVKETTVAYFKSLPRHLNGGREKNHYKLREDTWCAGHDSNHALPTCNRNS